MSLFQLRRQVYWDNNATTKVSKSVADKMDQVLRHCFGNPSSLYKDAHDSAAILVDARKKIASTVGAKEEELLFTGSATEASNQILKTMAITSPPNRKTIVLAATEHQSVISTVQYLVAHGMHASWLPMDSVGLVDYHKAEQLIDEHTALVCVMFVNNETGVVQNVSSLAALAHARGALMMSDCVQALGKIPVNVHQLGLDYAVFSAHKIHGPKGVGVLFAKEGSPLESLVHGGHQEHGLRAGTESVHNIAGFGEACAGVPSLLEDQPELAKLRSYFWRSLQGICPKAKLNVPMEHSVSNTLSIQFPGVANALLMGWLDFRGIAVSAGSACNTQENKPSHVLTAIGVCEEAARETLRISFGSGPSHRTTGKDVDYVLRCLNDFFSSKVPQVAGVSPAQLNENMLSDPNLFILDVRHGFDRKLLKSLPGALELEFPYRRHLHLVPKGVRILVVCQAGFDAPMIAFALRSQGHRYVAFLMAGMFGFRFQQPELYAKLTEYTKATQKEKP